MSDGAADATGEGTLEVVSQVVDLDLAWGGGTIGAAFLGRGS